MKREFVKEKIDKKIIGDAIEVENLLEILNCS